MSIDEIEYFGGGPHGSPSPTTMLVSLSQCSHFHLIGVKVLGFAKNRQRRDSVQYLNFGAAMWVGLLSFCLLGNGD